MEEPLPIATYAKVLAHLVRHRDRPIEEVLAALGVTPEQLQRADAHYNDRLVESYRLRKGVLAMTFASAFAEARKAEGLFTGEPATGLFQTGSLPAGAPAEPQALPSYMTAQPAPAAAPVQAIATPPAPVSMPVPAMAPPAMAPPVAPPAMAPAVQPPASLSQTAAPTTAEVPMMKSPPSAMPFRPAVTGTSAPSGATSSGPASTSAPSANAARSPATPAAGTGTAVSAADSPRLPDTPWDQAKNRVGKLTLAHYAALTVELSRNPSDMTPLYQRYGLSGPDDLRHVQAAFQAQIQFDANMRAQFEALVGRMRSMSTKRDA